jgi:hypothetical protein
VARWSSAVWICPSLEAMEDEAGAAAASAGLGALEFAAGWIDMRVLRTVLRSGRT